MCPASDTPPIKAPVDVVPAGAFSFPVAQVRETRRFGFLLLPEFTLLAFSSALDPLRIANQLAQKPLYGWVVLSETGDAVCSSSGVDVGAHGDLHGLTPDMHLWVCSGNRGTEVASDAVLQALRKHARFGGNMGGICTGAATLARAGLLQDRRFTLHWENQPGFVETFPDLQPTSRRFEADRGIYTCGGGAAATEMMLSIILEDYGEAFATAVSDMCLSGGDLSPAREQRSSIAKAINSRDPKVLAVLQAMQANIEDPLTLEELAEEGEFSRRQMERQFKKLFDETPATVYRNMRLDRARTLLTETNLNVTEIAMAAGFSSNGLFTRHYKARFNETPYGRRGKMRDAGGS
ncbi:GlxA family transcriptional regulator [Amylibacter cionae]|nr:GlxA family transcriptional regulator [Amylibacter cionae]